MAEVNLRAAAKQSWDSIFAIAYPKLGNMIRSINEEMERTLQDSSREIRSTTIAIEGFEQKIVQTKSNISVLIDSQNKINSYLSKIDWNPSAANSGGGDLNMPDLSKLKTIKEEKAKAKKAGENKGERGKSPEDAKKTKVEELSKNKGGIGGKLLNGAWWVSLGSTAFQTYTYISNLNPNDPDYSQKAYTKIMQGVAVFGFIEFAGAIAASIGSVIAPGYGTIIGAIGGLAAGWFFQEEVEDLTEYVITKIYEFKKKMAGGDTGATPGPAGDASGGPLAALSSSDNIKFVADKIIFASARISGMGDQGAQPESSGASQPGNFNFPIVPQTSGGGGSPAGVSGARVAPDVDTTRSAGMGQSGFLIPGRNSRVAASNIPMVSGFGGGQIEPASYGQSQTEAGPSDKPQNVRTEGSHVTLQGTDPSLTQAFYAAAAEYGKPVMISSGYRSDDYQAQIYARYLAGDKTIKRPARPMKAKDVTIGGRVYNVPGGGRGSPHTYGLAIDSPTAEAMDKAGVLRKHGLFRPYPADDEVHVQLVNGQRAPAPPTEAPAQQVASAPTTGANINKTSVNNKVENEKAQQPSSDMRINNVVSQGPSSQTGEQQTAMAPTGEVSSRDRVGRLVAQT